MATQNITIENGGWQDLITLGSLSLTNDENYTVAIRGTFGGEVCIASSKPADGFFGHTVKSDENFGFKYVTGDKIWVKTTPPTVVVFS